MDIYEKCHSETYSSVQLVHSKCFSQDLLIRDPLDLQKPEHLMTFRKQQNVCQKMEK